MGNALRAGLRRGPLDPGRRTSVTGECGIAARWQGVLPWRRAAGTPMPERATGGRGRARLHAAPNHRELSPRNLK